MTTGCSVAGWDHSRSVLYGPLESCSAQYQPLWIRRRFHLSIRRFCELDTSPFEHRNRLLCHAGCRRYLWHCSCGFGRSKAHSKGKVQGLPSTECRRQEILLLWGHGAVFNASFQCSVLLWEQHGLCILVFQAPDRFIFVLLSWPVNPHQPSHTWPREIHNGEKNKKAWNCNVHF